MSEQQQQDRGRVCAAQTERMDSRYKAALNPFCVLPTENGAERRVFVCLQVGDLAAAEGGGRRGAGRGGVSAGLQAFF
jgi:hypothetical protein